MFKGILLNMIIQHLWKIQVAKTLATDRVYYALLHLSNEWNVLNGCPLCKIFKCIDLINMRTIKKNIIVHYFFIARYTIIIKQIFC